jgi:hypothetical protein
VQDQNNVFQFHTGSIKSHTGSIKRLLCAMIEVWGTDRVGGDSCKIRITCFNSILVRLKAASSSAIATQRKKSGAPQSKGQNTFQFHTGSIKSAQRLWTDTEIAVSIPYWFD